MSMQMQLNRMFAYIKRRAYSKVHKHLLFGEIKITYHIIKYYTCIKLIHTKSQKNYISIPFKKKKKPFQLIIYS